MKLKTPMINGLFGDAAAGAAAASAPILHDAGFFLGGMAAGTLMQARMIYAVWDAC